MEISFISGSWIPTNVHHVIVCSVTFQPRLLDVSAVTTSSADRRADALVCIHVWIGCIYNQIMHLSEAECVLWWWRSADVTSGFLSSVCQRRAAERLTGWETLTSQICSSAPLMRSCSRPSGFSFIALQVKFLKGCSTNVDVDVVPEQTWPLFLFLINMLIIFLIKLPRMIFHVKIIIFSIIFYIFHISIWKWGFLIKTCTDCL